MISGLCEGTVTVRSALLTQITALPAAARAKSIIMSASDSPDLRLAAQASGQLGCRDTLTKNENDSDNNGGCCAALV